MKSYLLTCLAVAGFIQCFASPALGQTQDVSCVTTSDTKGGGGFGTSPSGQYVVQGSHSCLIAADINSGIASGHSLASSASTPTSAADAVAACLKKEGYYNPTAGVTPGPGYAAALCKCNLAAFSQKFRCSTLSFGGALSASDITNLNDKMKEKCIVILNVEFSKPEDPNGKPKTRHAVGFAGGMVGPDGDIGFDVRDPNSPDHPFNLDVDPTSHEIDLIGPYGFMMGYRYASIVSVMFKCPEEETSRATEFEPQLPQ